MTDLLHDLRMNITTTQVPCIHYYNTSADDDKGYITNRTVQPKRNALHRAKITRDDTRLEHTPSILQGTPTNLLATKNRFFSYLLTYALVFFLKRNIKFFTTGFDLTPLLAFRRKYTEANKCQRIHGKESNRIVLKCKYSLVMVISVSLGS